MNADGEALPTDDGPILYSELAAWWPLLSPPEDYAEEAAFYSDVLRGHCGGEATSLLELGSGGGNNASHMKSAHEEVTLVDRSPEMLAVSQALNPKCEHIVGDMRSVRLGRSFDHVFVHDAIGYMTKLPDLRLVMETAYAHCNPGGGVLFAPDFVRETFRSGTGHGGHDSGDRGLRYLEWTWDPDPDDTLYVVDFAYLLRDSEGGVEVRRDRHLEGMFPTREWTESLEAVGFDPLVLPTDHGENGVGEVVFVGIRR